MLSFEFDLSKSIIEVLLNIRHYLQMFIYKNAYIHLPYLMHKVYLCLMSLAQAIIIGHCKTDGVKENNKMF